MRLEAEKYIEKTSNINLEVSENGILLILNKEGKKVESIQFKELIKATGNQKEAMEIYHKIKELSENDFKDSKLRDENGELMIVWHGSSRKFENFDPNAKGQ